MWIWLGVVVVFFSLPRSKPIGYSMPVLFPLAFLIAEPALAAWRQAARAGAGGRRQPGRWPSRSAWRVAGARCAYDRRQHRAGANALRAVRAPGEPDRLLRRVLLRRAAARSPRTRRCR
jgi:hypothetical protein